MKKLLTFALILITYDLLLSPVFAQTIDTPVASPSAIQEQLKERIKSVVQEQLKSTEANLESKTNTIMLVGYQGTVADITQYALTLVSDKTNFQVSADLDTVIVKSGKNIKFEQLSIKDLVLVIGTLDSNEILKAKRVVVLVGQTTPPAKQIIFAPISKISLKNKTVTVSLNQKDVVLNPSKNLKLDLATLTLGQKLFAVIETTTLLLAKAI